MMGGEDEVELIN